MNSAVAPTPQVELHRHLDVSLRLSTLLELAQARGHVAQSTSLAAFRQQIVLSTPLDDLAAVLATFALFPKVLDRFEVLERVAFEVVEDCRSEGTQWVELRFSPSFVAEHSGMPWEEVLGGFEAGIQRAMRTYPEMRAGLIGIASRDFGPDAAAKTVEFCLKQRHRLLGIDLAGNETNFPCRQFADAFKPVRGSGLPLTVHAGEGAGPENIWEAIDLLGAQRIGHGIACVLDPDLMKVLKEQSICLEVCPTSNWLTQCTPSLAQHPLPNILRAGVPVSINTDDPAVFGTDLRREFEICRTEMGLTESEIEQCRIAAMAATFFKPL